MADTSERSVILSALLLVIIIVISQAMNLSDKFSPSEKTAIQISRDFLDGVGHKTGRVLFIKYEEKEPNFYWDIALKSDVEWDRLDIWARARGGLKFNPQTQTPLPPPPLSPLPPPSHSLSLSLTLSPNTVTHTLAHLTRACI